MVKTSAILTVTVLSLTVWRVQATPPVAMQPAAATQPGGRVGPLAGLPSAPGPHIAKIQALGDNEWIELGPPAGDPKWGKARGRSWSSKMVYIATAP